MQVNYNRACLVAPLACLLSACGGSSNSQSTAPPPVGGTSVQVAGNVVAGPVNGATVTAYSVSADGSNGTALGTATSGTDGAFTLTLSSQPTGGVRLVISSGSYQSEANTSTTVSGTTLSAILASIPSSGSTGVSVSPLTTFSDQNAVAQLVATPSTSLTTAVANADSRIKLVYGIQDSTSALTALAPSFTTASGDAATLALVLGTLEQLAIQVGQTPAAVIQAIAQDLSDGILDGKAAGGTPISYAASSSAPSNLANTLFLNAIAAYADPGNTATIAHSNGVTFSTSVVVSLRTGIVGNSSASTGLDVSSSGAITSLTTVDSGGSTHQSIYFAAHSSGLQAIDFTNPAAPATVDQSALNTLLMGGSSPLLPSIDGVISIPVGSGHPQLLVYSYNSATVAVVDPVTSTMVAHAALTIAAGLSCSGALPSISGGIPDTGAATPLVWLSTGSGYLPITLSNGQITQGTPTASPNGAGLPENMGASVVDRILFAPGYCYANGSNGTPGLTLVDLDTQKAFSLDTTDYAGGFGSIDEPDSGAVDTKLKVGVAVDEHTSTFSFIDLRNLKSSTAYTFDSTAGTFTPANPAKQLKSFNLANFPSISGININSASHLAFIIEEFGDALAVASLDDPASPANTTAGWAGFTDYRTEASQSFGSGTPTPFCAAGDPHSEATISHFSNGHTYGFALNTCDSRNSSGMGAVIVDMQNFIAAPVSATGAHDLKNNAFTDPTLIQMVKF